MPEIEARGESELPCALRLSRLIEVEVKRCIVTANAVDVTGLPLPTLSGKQVRWQVASAEISQIVSGELTLVELAARFPLSWSQYVRLLSVENEIAREFYEAEALRGRWTVRQLNRQIGSQFYERTMLFPHTRRAIREPTTSQSCTHQPSRTIRRAPHVAARPPNCTDLA